MSKQLRLDVAQLTDVGRKRPHNEDNMAYVIPKDPQVMARKGALFIVADGMGGHAAGEVASEIAVDTVSNAYYQDDSDDVAVSLLHAIRRANSLIHQRAAENMLRSGMGTTCVAAVLRGNSAYIANVGDSRAYLIRGGQVKQISQDHSWVAEQVRAGLLTEEQARSHAQRNVITRCLGTQAEVEIDVFPEQLEQGDAMILCTDGLSGLVGDEDLRSIVDQYVPQESVYHLVERANENGGPDNITAIVIRVSEVGWEPPNARYPVRVGGREMGDDTAILGRLSGSQTGVSLRADDFRSPGATLRVPTGALVSPDSITAPQPALKTTGPRRSRLFYPTLILFVLLIVALIAGGSYFFIRSRNDAANVDTSLRTASGLIDQAKTAVAQDPATALNRLASARTNLLAVQNTSLSDTQHAQFETLQRSFTSTVQSAITAYNQHAKIVPLPCASTSSTAITGGSMPVQAKALTIIQDTAGKNSLSYVLGDDKNLYQLTAEHTLGKKVSLGNPDTAHVEAVASTGSRVLALVSFPTQASTLTYKLTLLLPQPDGSLQVANTLPLGMPAGYLPKFLTAWNSNVSVVLLPQEPSTSPQIVSYTLAGTGKGQHFNTPPTNTTISISKSIVSLAVLNAGQKSALIFLLSDGSIQSLQLANGKSVSPSPVNVLTNSSIPAPLSVSATTFALSQQTPVPTPFPQTTGPSLSVPGATLLAGSNDGSHLYVVAPAVNGIGARLLDLKLAQGPANVSKTPTPAPASSTAGAVGGGVAAQDTSVYMDLAQQYAPDHSLLDVKSMVADPKGNGFYLLTQNGQKSATSLLVAQNTSCIP